MNNIDTYKEKILINYLLMLISSKKYKEHKTLCYCRECGKVSIIQK